MVFYSYKYCYYSEKASLLLAEPYDEEQKKWKIEGQFSCLTMIVQTTSICSM